MKNRKINVDRPQLKTDEILARRNFDEVMTNHAVMTKPFYRQNWFVGTTGLASLGLIIGGTLALQANVNKDQVVSEKYLTDAPPNNPIPDNSFIVQLEDLKPGTKDLVSKTIQFNPQKTEPIEENFTQEENVAPKVDLNAPISKDEKSSDDIVLLSDAIPQQTNEIKSTSFMDMSPRISDKLGGSITRDELMDNKGITTEGDINIIHFELHLIDGLGGQVFEEEGNQLNEEMKNALDEVGKGETIYFENIRGKVKNGTEVRLNPLRYVLMN